MDDTRLSMRGGLQLELASRRLDAEKAKRRQSAELVAQPATGLQVRPGSLAETVATSLERIEVLKHYEQRMKAWILDYREAEYARWLIAMEAFERGTVGVAEDERKRLSQTVRQQVSSLLD